ncbi:MAG: sugar isomerase domain-containing protein [Lentisphaerae bacterium]|nr:sugar isomerase domain-containing protein [Lentisphaerota bacterium]
MNALICEYTKQITRLLESIARDEEANILAAAELLSDKVVEGRLINVFGAGGHSAIGAMEIFWRAGGLAQVNGMFPAGTNIISALPTTAKVQGLAPFILNFYDVYKDDVLILVNFYGLNIISVDVAIEAKKRGVKLITVNAHQFAKTVPADFIWRHPSKKNINEFADVAVDNHVPYPDAILKADGIEEEFGPTATTLTCFTLNCMMAETIRLIREKGGKPEIWVSNNIPGCDEHNKPIHDKYRRRIHHLYPVW